MVTVKARKVGNSMIVTLPKEFDIKAGTEFFVYKGVDGALVLAPKIENPFDGEADLTMTDDFKEVIFLDNE
ncbi:AbrB/MazE/SpoVT family DNA-binding domain-containing protein [Streptococcus sp. H31]|uniref:type II toxin-antitoxin system PemI/MazE family antitoxin n=1 Tax=Streptococcus huangxiaojuni TaxID=3237239 RepID=UPI0034A3276E